MLISTFTEVLNPSVEANPRWKYNKHETNMDPEQANASASGEGSLLCTILSCRSPTSFSRYLRRSLGEVGGVGHVSCS